MTLDEVDLFKEFCIRQHLEMSAANGCRGVKMAAAVTVMARRFCRPRSCRATSNRKFKAGNSSGSTSPSTSTSSKVCKDCDDVYYPTVVLLFVGTTVLVVVLYFYCLWSY
jgi:hypothetical protein